MTKVYLKYNPYTVESEIKIDGVLVKKPNKLADLVNERLQVWVEDLIPILNEACNDDEYEIDFYGTGLDYSDLKVCINEYCEANCDIKVSINYTQAKGSEDRFSELKTLFEEMQRSCPFEDLTTEQIRENFQNAISSEFEVSVIATMSSGKSTLINALLGRELMPSKNEACTATIARIKDIDGMDHFEAVYFDQNKKELGSFPKLVLDNMVQMNDNPETAYIDIQGDIPNISSKEVQLVLVDTPGPNNSRNEEHEEHTYRVIEEKSKPMVLYVLNATQLQTDDDKNLLEKVSEAMKVGGKQSKDRFLFVVNKVDLFDPERESVQGAIKNVQEYLDKFEIKNPNIFPTSAELAKVIRMNEAGQELTSAQKRTLRDYDFFIEEEQLHLSEQAALSKDNMQRIREMTQAAKASQNGHQEALIHTGIPAIELAINEYLEKYAYTIKVKTAVDTFRKKVVDKDMRGKMMLSIQNNEEARAKINSQLKAVKEQLEAGEAGAEFRKKIQALDMMQQADAEIQRLRTKVNEIAKNSSQKNQMTMLEVTQMMMRLDRKIRDLQSDVKTELENIIEDVINQGGQKIIEDYRKHVHSLIASGDLETSSYSGECSINFLEEAIPDAQELINQYKYTEKVDTGERETVKNWSHKWWDILEFFEPRTITKKIFTNVEMVDSNKVYGEYIEPIIAGFFKNLDSARKTAQRETEKFKRFFLKELDALENALQKKVEEDEKLTRDQSSIEKKLKEDQAKFEWLESFIERLDEILAI